MGYLIFCSFFCSHTLAFVSFEVKEKMIGLLGEEIGLRYFSRMFEQQWSILVIIQHDLCCSQFVGYPISGRDTCELGSAVPNKLPLVFYLQVGDHVARWC